MCAIYKPANLFGRMQAPLNPERKTVFLKSMLRTAAAAIIASLMICLLVNCTQNAMDKAIIARTDSLFINAKSVHTVTTLINHNFLSPGHKKTQYKIEYINETWPDTISRVQANKLLALKDLHAGFEKALSISQSLQQRSLLQLQQLNKLNQQINSGALTEESLYQYLTFEIKCADSLNRALDTLVKRSIELSCKSQSL